MIERQGSLSLSRQCELLGLSRAALYYRVVRTGAYELELMALIGIAAYFEFYNHQRLQQALAYRTPRQVFDEALRFASLARRKNAGACPTLSAQ
jgi:hypothetical protein